MRTALAIVALTALAAPSLAAAHRGGRAEPRIAAAVTGRGVDQTILVRLVDADSGEPVRGARVEVTAEMTRPHVMRLAPWRLPERGDGTYRALVRFPMAAEWTLEIDAEGNKLVPARATTTRVVSAEPSRPATGTATAAPLPTVVDDRVNERDVVTMVALWLHSISALGWIVGVLVMALALSARPGVLAERFRLRLRAAYLDWGAWLHWGLVPAIVLTGIYNVVDVTPFPLAWRPGDLARLGNIPYGALYEAILAVKLGLFAALLITGTQLLRRVTREPRTKEPPSIVAALGPSGLLYVATVPLILGAAMALRYVHVLSHVGEVLRAA